MRPRSGHSGIKGELRLDVASCLTKNEADIFALMLDAVKMSATKTVVRVAGGWVRDKLLGLENEDIDIALDNCTGVVFAQLVNTYLKFKGEEEGKVATIKANPEQSKHLETARMKIMGVWVDLVNLRTETYSSNSRIPEATFGTAEEDALRRDFTINALFYNVTTRQVEDMTNRGVDDLQAGIIRTPLSSMATFDDDPLRVLRALRFASRFGFTLHEDLRAAAQDREIQAALETKVSRERVGAELCGMLTGKMAQPGLALSLLQELGLAQAVYAPPENLTQVQPERGYDWARGAAVARAATRVLAFREGLQAQTEATMLHAHEACEEDSTGGGRLHTPAVDMMKRGVTMTKMGVKTVSEHVHGGSNDFAKYEVSAQSSSSSNMSKSGVEGSGLASAAVERECGHDITAAAGAASTGEEIADDARKPALKGKEKAKAMIEDKPKAKEGGKAGGNQAAGEPKTFVRELFLSAVLVPLGGVQHKIKKKLVPAAQSIVQESLKLKSEEAKNVGEILEILPAFRRLADIHATGWREAGLAGACEEGGDGRGKGHVELPRLDVGLAVRQVKELWSTCVDLCCAVEMCESQVEEPKHATQTAANELEAVANTSGGGASPGGKRARVEGDRNGGLRDENSEDRIMAKYANFAEAVRRMGLGTAWRIPTLVGGNDVIGELGVQEGPKVGQLMTKQVHWQLEHPDGTRESCLRYLKAVLEQEA